MQGGIKVSVYPFFELGAAAQRILAGDHVKDARILPQPQLNPPGQGTGNMLQGAGSHRRRHQLRLRHLPGHRFRIRDA
ncbi:hypothetical protein D3C76_1569070 [compost metagenome]